LPTPAARLFRRGFGLTALASVTTVGACCAGSATNRRTGFDTRLVAAAFLGMGDTAGSVAGSRSRFSRSGRAGDGDGESVSFPGLMDTPNGELLTE